MSRAANNISEYVYVGILLAVFAAVLASIYTGLTGVAANIVNTFLNGISGNIGLVTVVFLVIVAVWVLGYVRELQKTKGK